MNTYLFVLGIKLSDNSIKYTGVKLLKGETVDNAFNREYLDTPPVGDWVVMEVYKIEVEDASIPALGIEADGPTKLRRIL